MFSFLFGLSTALIVDRAVGRTERPRVVLLRRLLTLGVIGAAHQLLQPGEALLPYALVGLVVLLPATWLPRVVVLLGGLAGTAVPLVAGIAGLGLVPGLFLLGLASARYGLPAALDRPVRWRWTLVLVGAVALTVPLLVLQVGDIANSGFSRVSAIAGLALAVTYCAGLVLLLHGRLGAVLSGVLAPLGRLSLTNYLSATLVVAAATGPLGLADGDSYGVALVLACVIVVGQVLAGRWWTTRFRYGPAEWVLRTVSWWSPAPMRQPARARRARGPDAVRERWTG
ncbi:DUF418 domain-containing protein [Pseudonocardia sp. KRD291]|uniref:DUF418 domain-containing protein n=1 Tax=Pseudonocardia sp. KRD291 TaxID=2792007 RepID=UPI001C4A3103|nr:DUF418 domain-containing protein [Pseudonocardia sp. KRD291]MBW0101371.1 DUF418 domain-containing protein [Pseudonocardia sp. KRD291]